MSPSPSNSPEPVVSLNKITNDIFIGNFAASKNIQCLKMNNIRSIVSLNGELSGIDPKSIGVEKIICHNLIDGDGNGADLFKRAVQAVTKCLAATAPVLVHCQAGRSRSVIVVASHFVSKGLYQSIDDALAYISTKRDINVTAALKDLARRCYN